MTSENGSGQFGRVEEMVAALETRRGTCRQLLELSHAQLAHIQRADYTGLLRLLTEKQNLLSQQDALSQRYPNTVLRQWWVESRENLDPAWKQRCRYAMQETEQILEQLLSHEQQCTDLLTQQRNATYDQLQTISQGSRVHAAYRDNLAPLTHRHLDVDQ